MAARLDRSLVLIPVLAAVILVMLWMALPAESLVVYCAHDAEYSQTILDDFTRETGIRVQVRFDTEATKSLGLINLIVQERQQPRCDVFWNNELLGMVELREQGLLEAYQGTGWKRIPEQFRDNDGHWVGFAARMRVTLFNVNEVKADDASLERLLSSDLAHFAIAKPLFGTTLTHYTVLWNLWGPERVKDWHNGLRARGIREVDGNAAVKDLVAAGACHAGYTDNDDAFVALDSGKPVEMQPVRLELPGKMSSSSEQSPGTGDPQTPAKITICIPNTAGIIKGTKRRVAAERLLDFLASERTEIALARSKSRQIPLGSVDQKQLPEDVQKLAQWSREGTDLRPLLPARRECLKWLTSEYVK